MSMAKQVVEKCDKNVWSLPVRGHCRMLMHISNSRRELRAVHRKKKVKGKIIALHTALEADDEESQVLLGNFISLVGFLKGFTGASEISHEAVHVAMRYARLKLKNFECSDSHEEIIAQIVEDIVYAALRRT